jgi:tripartite-type tricarboxylate transporter receptor subunit TctC
MKKIVTLGLLAMSLVFGTAVSAQPKPYKIIVAAPVGSGPDVISRKLAERVESRLGQPVLVINKPGANGAIALQEFNSDPDVDRLIYFGDMQSVMIHPILSGQEKTLDNIKHVVPFFKADFMLAVSPKVQNFDNLVANIGQGKTSYGSWGVGSPPHVMGEELARLYKDNKSIHVPYKEYSQWFIDTSSQNLSYSFVSVGSTLGLEQKGALKYLAVTSAQRNPKFPNVPTLRELTKNQIEPYQAWATLATHKGANPAAADAIKNAIVASLPEIYPMFGMVNLIVWSASPAELDAFISQESNKYRSAFKKYNISN